MTETLKAIKDMMLTQFDENTDSGIFFDAWYLHDLNQKTEEYKALLLKEPRPLELLPLMVTPYSMRALVTPSARKAGEWQVTLFDKTGQEPQGHICYNTFEEAILDNVDEWFANGLWCW